MTLFKRQFIPVLRWGYYVDSIEDMEAIVNPLEGAFAQVDGEGFYQYQNGEWIKIFSEKSACCPPVTLWYTYHNDDYSGDSLEINEYDFQDPTTLPEQHGNFIHELFINGVRQYYKETPTVIGEFGIDLSLPGLIFPYTLDHEKIQYKALIL